jgi:hypothetical protein
VHDIGGIVWVAIVIIGVISSIVQNAQKARRAAQAGGSRPTQQPPQRPAAVRTVPVRIDDTGSLQEQLARYASSGTMAPSSLPSSRPAAPPVAQIPKPPAPVQAPPSATPASASARTVRRAPPAVPQAQAWLSPLDLPRRKRTGIAKLFADRRSLTGAFIAAEVLGKPRALRDE